MRIKLAQDVIDFFRAKKKTSDKQKQKDDLAELRKSYFYLLLDSLLKRDVNKNYDIYSGDTKKIAYTDKWVNYKYILNNDAFFPFSKNMPEIPTLIVLSGIWFGEQQLEALYYAQYYNIPILIMEDGFIRSATTYADETKEDKFLQGISFNFDNLSAYFDATAPSNLEQMLNNKDLVLTQEQKLRARKLINRIIETKLTKYNHQPIFTPNIGKNKKKVLVVDQSFGDMSIARGGANEKTFKLMLEQAIQENPDADIIVKTHPDTMTGNRGGYYTGLKEHDNIYTITEPINPISLIQYVDKVYVCTTQFGFEALMCNKEVVIFGLPFYAGWGLADERQELPRRTNKRTLEEVFYIAYIIYTKYFNPETKKECEIEEAIDYLLKLREEYNEKYSK